MITNDWIRFVFVPGNGDFAAESEKSQIRVAATNPPRSRIGTNQGVWPGRLAARREEWRRSDPTNPPPSL